MIKIDGTAYGLVRGCRYINACIGCRTLVPDVSERRLIPRARGWSVRQSPQTLLMAQRRSPLQGMTGARVRAQYDLEVCYSGTPPMLYVRGHTVSTLSTGTGPHPVRRDTLIRASRRHDGGLMEGARAEGLEGSTVARPASAKSGG
jgi:hypothetical protein